MFGFQISVDLEDGAGADGQMDELESRTCSTPLQHAGHSSFLGFLLSCFDAALALVWQRGRSVHATLINRHSKLFSRILAGRFGLCGGLLHGHYRNGPNCLYFPEAKPHLHSYPVAKWFWSATLRYNTVFANWSPKSSFRQHSLGRIIRTGKSLTLRT